ncbi:alpha/beta hydrolase family esterase [Nocardia sp. NPDC052566]|uniref:alpha/beta hydrolase family esterase n=1 Tax=Nocardia sp. NPDC052566 TaxID=3364330 RepID=UPI0037C93BD6
MRNSRTIELPRAVRLAVLLGVLTLALGVAGCRDVGEPSAAPRGSSTVAKDGRDTTETITVDGKRATFVLHVPPGLPSNAPAVLAFHGRGGSGAQMAAKSGLNAVADANHFVVAYPDNFMEFRPASRTRSSANSVSYVTAIIDKLAVDQHISRTRVFATGVSLGGAYTQMLGCDAADKLAAIAPTLSGMPAGYVKRCNPSRPLSVYELHGTADPIVPYDGGTVVSRGGPGDGTEVLSAPDTAALWRTKNGCQPPAAPTTVPDKVNDGTHITITATTSCRNNTQVQLVTVEGGGHIWPGTPQYLPESDIGKASQNLNTAQSIWTFFAAL